MPIHRIHLKGPWEFAWRSTPAFQRADAPQEADCFLDDARLRMPVEWRDAFGDRAGTIEFARRFQWPTNLDPGERAFLVFHGIGGSGSAMLNGELLGTLADAPATFEVTDRLKSTNRLCVTLTFDPQHAGDKPGGLWAPVALEIEELPSPPAVDDADAL